MFGLQDDTQKSNDDPAMLDNVKDLASQPAAHVEPPQASADAGSAPAPAVSTFSMPNDSPAPDPAPTADNSQAPVVAPDSTANTPEPVGHPEVAEGFSSNPTFETPSSDSNSNDNTQSAQDDSSSDSSEETAEPTSAITAPPVIQSTSTPADSTPSDPVQNDVSAPPAPVETTVEPETNASAPSDESTPAADVNHDQLASIKQEALGHLEGLTDHIEGNPEEVFRTTMQMIQANDNHTLIEKALDAAKKIEDDKVRAQAMLDIVNEVNYFSQNKDN